MIVDTPEEIKNRENRDALTPPITLKLTQSGHNVLTEKPLILRFLCFRLGICWMRWLEEYQLKYD